MGVYFHKLLIKNPVENNERENKRITTRPRPPHESMQHFKSQFVMVCNSKIFTETKLEQTCSRNSKIKTKDDTDKSSLKSNQSIIQLHNSTVTVNKKEQKEQNCARNCALLNTGDVERG